MVQTETANLIVVFSSIIIIVCAISSIGFLFIEYACGRFGHKCKQLYTSKTTSDPAEKIASRNERSQLSQTPGPLYEELQSKSIAIQENQNLVELKENVAYGPIAK